MSNTTTLTTKTYTHTPLSTESMQAQKMSTYYQIHAKIYDLTRWTFLFGRKRLIDWLPFERTDQFTLIEVGCGTGHNLKYIAQSFPKSKLIGLDASSDMLLIAQNKFKNTYNKPILLNILYKKRPSTEGGVAVFNPKVILFSYCLTMVNPGWESLILQAQADLDENGVIAVVDFHNSSSRLFKKWMGKNHVRMDGHLLPFLKQHFTTVKLETRRAYLGLWHYSLYIGRKDA